MRSFILSAVLLTLLGTVYAQKSALSWFNNTSYQLKDGHSIVLREDGKVMYDGRFLFERCKDNSLMSENYIPFEVTITTEKGSKEKVYAAFETHEVKANSKVWFTIYEGALGGMRQSYFASNSDQQAKL